VSRQRGTARGLRGRWSGTRGPAFLEAVPFTISLLGLRGPASRRRRKVPRHGLQTPRHRRGANVEHQAAICNTAALKQKEGRQQRRSSRKVAQMEGHIGAVRGRHLHRVQPGETALLGRSLLGVAPTGSPPAPEGGLSEGTGWRLEETHLAGKAEVSKPMDTANAVRLLKRSVSMATERILAGGACTSTAGGGPANNPPTTTATAGVKRSALARTEGSKRKRRLGLPVVTTHVA
jgi:hypothetical protein